MFLSVGYVVVQCRNDVISERLLCVGWEFIFDPSRKTLSNMIAVRLLCACPLLSLFRSPFPSKPRCRCCCLQVYEFMDADRRAAEMRSSKTAVLCTVFKWLAVYVCLSLPHASKNLEHTK